MLLVPMSRESRELSRRLDRLFDDGFESVFGALAPTEGATSRSPALDVTESERDYSVKLDMPGVAKEDIKVMIDGRHVTVQAQSQHKEEKKEGDRVVWRERSLTSYARTFSLPLEVDQVESGAKFENGVLTLTLPKRNAAARAQIKVA
ncbi:MAG: Hsp20/alpha crystallin family protein [Rubrivivax sp.]|nr:Hsp20/alpha crystallin family protein [Rubrivivax sp.]